MSKYIITEVCICIVPIVALITQIMHSIVPLLGAAAFGIGPVAIGIWALVEGIMILTGKINTDANGVALI